MKETLITIVVVVIVGISGCIKWTPLSRPIFEYLRAI